MYKLFTCCQNQNRLYDVSIFFLTAYYVIIWQMSTIVDFHYVQPCSVTKIDFPEILAKLFLPIWYFTFGIKQIDGHKILN